MSSNTDNEIHDPVANLHMQPVRGILKSSKSIDDAGQDLHKNAKPIVNNCSTTGMTRSESKSSHKIPHFDEMNIIATYHPPDKDYGHMKIEEPKTPYAPNDIIDEEIDNEPTVIGVDPDALAQKLNASKDPLPKSSRLNSDPSLRQSIDEDIELSTEELEHRKHFENHRKQHYNEFEVVRLRKKEIEDELRALEQEEQKEKNASASNKSNGNGNETVTSSHGTVESIKPILIHHDSKDSTSSSGHHHHHHHHVHVEDEHEDKQLLTPEEQERKRQFELKRKKHYNEFRATRLADKKDDERGTTE